MKRHSIFQLIHIHTSAHKYYINWKGELYDVSLDLFVDIGIIKEANDNVVCKVHITVYIKACNTYVTNSKSAKLYRASTINA